MSFDFHLLYDFSNAADPFILLYALPSSQEQQQQQEEAEPKPKPQRTCTTNGILVGSIATLFFPWSWRIAQAIAKTTNATIASTMECFDLTVEARTFVRRADAAPTGRSISEWMNESFDLIFQRFVDFGRQGRPCSFSNGIVENTVFYGVLVGKMFKKSLSCLLKIVFYDAFRAAPLDEPHTIMEIWVILFGFWEKTTYSSLPSSFGLDSSILNSWF